MTRAAEAAVVEADVQDAELVPQPEFEGLGMIPPPELRARIKASRTMVGKDILAYIGDTVWEFAMLKHQYNQGVKSPWMESMEARFGMQAKASTMLFNHDILTYKEKGILQWGVSGTSMFQAKKNTEPLMKVGFNVFGASRGLCSLLGYMYLDEDSDDSRLEAVFRALGMLDLRGSEDRMLEEVCEGFFTAPKRAPAPYFLALSPLGHAALRLYISRYLVQRAPRADEFIYRVKLALQQEELDLAAVGFMRDDATPNELGLMKGARDQKDSYAFAFECLLGYLALNIPYRLHQIISSFGFTSKLPGT